MGDRETNDLYLGSPLFDSGERRDDGYGPGRYSLEVVYRDGFPRKIGSYDYPGEALDALEHEREAFAGQPRGSYHLQVIDTEDPERGELTWAIIDERRS